MMLTSLVLLYALLLPAKSACEPLPYSAPIKIADFSNPKTFLAADLDKDGDVDFVVANGATNQVYIVENLGNRSFGPKISLPVAAPIDLTRECDLAAADFNNNGILDIVVAGLHGLAIWWSGPGLTTYSPSMTISDDSALGVGCQVATADFDNNNLTDIMYILCGPESGKIYFYGNTGAGTFLERCEIFERILGGSNLMRVGDILGNGFPDVAVASANPAVSNATDLHLFYNNGLAQFTLTQIGFEQSLTNSLAVGNVDSDQQFDVATTSSTSFSLYTGIFRQQQSNTYYYYNNNVTSGLSHVALADVTGDAKLDILLVQEDVVLVVEQNASGAFLVPSDLHNHTLVAAPAKILQLDTGEFLGNHSTDIVVATARGLFWFVPILPTQAPSLVPSNSQTSVTPSAAPSGVPSARPSEAPSSSSSDAPSTNPSTTPSQLPSSRPSHVPSDLPSAVPSNLPSMVPTATPSALPSFTPSVTPTSIPSKSISMAPTTVPNTRLPTVSPSEQQPASGCAEHLHTLAILAAMLGGMFL